MEISKSYLIYLQDLSNVIFIKAITYNAADEGLILPDKLYLEMLAGNPMNKQAFQWLDNHKIWNFIILIGYYLAVVLPHKRFGAFLNDSLFKRFSREEYNSIILSAAIVILTGLVIVFYRNTAGSEVKARLRFYLFSTVLFSVLIISTLFVINIEIVHFFQYALFAVLIFPLVGTFNGALLWSVLAGAIDEAYQYFYLAPMDTSYYDFNDVITNLVGAALGLIFLRSFNVREKRKVSFYASSAFKGLIVLGLILIFCLAFGYLSIYPSEETSFQLVRERPESFWASIPLGFTYHVVSPVEGLMAVVLLLVFYSRIGKD